MSKISWRPGTMVYPLPAALVTVGATPEEWNPITVAWIGTICSDPAMLYISVRPERHSHAILMERMEFTVNLTTADMARATDWCGVRSGKDFDNGKKPDLLRFRERKWLRQPSNSPLSALNAVSSLSHRSAATTCLSPKSSTSGPIPVSSNRRPTDSHSRNPD